MTGNLAPSSQSQPSVPLAFKDHPIRTVVEDGNPWFAARDVARALNLVWHGSILSSIPEPWKRVRSFLTQSKSNRGGGSRDMTTISEPAVYKLAFRSNKPEADEFTNWVASEVLPAIRKTGQFQARPEPTPVLPRRSTAKERNRLAALMDAYIGAMEVTPNPEAYKAAWRKIHRLFGVKDIAHLTVDQLPVAERFLEELTAGAKPKALPVARESTVRDYAGVYKNLPAHNALWKQLKMRLYNASAAYGLELAEIRVLAAQPFKECRKSDIGTLFDSIMDPIGAHFQAAQTAEHAVYIHASTALDGYTAAHAFLTRG